MRLFALISFVLLLMSACVGHQPESHARGVSVTGKAGVGVGYSRGRARPSSNASMTFSIGS